jgi:hypothetical protein
MEINDSILFDSNIKCLDRNSKNLTLGATKRIIKKAYLEPKLLNFERCSFVPTKLSLRRYSLSKIK